MDALARFPTPTLLPSAFPTPNPQAPFSPLITPRKFPFYYGWVILVVATLGIIMSIPGQTMGVSVFTDSLIAAFAVGRTPLSFAYMLGTGASSFLLPLAGRLLDRRGARFMVVVATTGLSASLLFLCAGPTLVHTVFGESTTEWHVIPVLFLAFLGIRHFGQGQMTMIARTMLGRWFESRRGLAFAISGAMVAYAFGVAPYWLDRLIESAEWRGAILVLIVAEGVMMVIGLLFYRGSVEECGMEMEEGLAPRESASVASARRDWTAPEVKRSFVFWVFNAAVTWEALLITAIVFHFEAICTSHGLKAADGFALFVPMAIAGTVTQMVASYLSDKISIRYHLLFMQVTMFLGTVSVVFLGTEVGQVGFVIGHGMTNGFFATLTGVAWPKLFGRKHLGAINGVVTSCIVFGSALGPFAYSLVQDFTHGFNVAILLSALPAIPIFVAGVVMRMEE